MWNRIAFLIVVLFGAAMAGMGIYGLTTLPDVKKYRGLYVATIAVSIFALVVGGFILIGVIWINSVTQK